PDCLPPTGWGTTLVPVAKVQTAWSWWCVVRVYVELPRLVVVTRPREVHPPTSAQRHEPGSGGGEESAVPSCRQDREPPCAWQSPDRKRVTKGVVPSPRQKDWRV